MGKPVTWKFDDGGLEHTVTADDKLVRLRPDVVGDVPEDLQHRRARPYHCEVHARMKGTIVVTG